MLVFSFSIPYLHPVSHLYKGTGWMEGSSSTGIQVGAVVVMHDFDVVYTIRLKDTHKKKLFQLPMKSHKTENLIIKFGGKKTVSVQWILKRF